MTTVIEEHPAIPQEINLSLSSYLLRFRKLCERDSTLKSEVLESKSHLSLEGFRSILWSRWLNILSPSMKDWSADITRHRTRYNNLRAQYLMDKRLDGSIHLSVNNPLSQDVQSPWNQFFQDNELKCDIERVRTPTYHWRGPAVIATRNCKQLFLVYASKFLWLEPRFNLYLIRELEPI